MAGAPLIRCRLDLPAIELPLALADLHRRVEPGATVEVRLPRSDPGGLPGPFLLAGAGFTPLGRGRYRRELTLPDYVAARMRVLFVGLNPSVYAARAGIGFARPGNRFWPALLASGLARIDRDPRDALVAHHLGMTDLVKRATARADELAPEEYVAGFDRVRRLVEWLAPGVVCFVGLTGYRIALDRTAVAGPQAQSIGTSTVYVMPNPSGINAHATVGVLTNHFRTVGDLAGGSPRR